MTSFHETHQSTQNAMLEQGRFTKSLKLDIVYKLHTHEGLVRATRAAESNRLFKVCRSDCKLLACFRPNPLSCVATLAGRNQRWAQHTTLGHEV